MDKQKQIEEMARDICNMCRDMYGVCDNKEELCPAIKAEMEYLYNTGYRKIPGNAVVLTKEAYENIGIYTETVQEYECDENGQPVLVKERKEVKKTPTDIAEFIRKKTAEKFANDIEDILKQPFEGKTEKQEWQRKGMEEGLRMALEICKEIIGERK